MEIIHVIGPCAMKLLGESVDARPAHEIHYTLSLLYATMSRSYDRGAYLAYPEHV